MTMRTSETPIKTKRPIGVLLAVMAITASVLALLLWFVTALRGLTDIFRLMTRLCHHIFSQCLGYLAIGRMALLWAAGLTLLFGLLYATFRAVTTLIRSRRALNRLPLKNKKAGLVLIDDSTMTTAFTHGIIHPRIYISKGLMDNLDGPELRAVFHHELCHKKNRDPLRFFLLSILKDVLFFIPLAAHASRLIIDNQEKLADNMAVSSMREPFSIAGALVKVADTVSIRPVEMASILGRRGNLEERIGRLLGEKGGIKGKKRPGAGAILMSFFIPAFLLISFALPLKQGIPSKMSCTMTHCSTEKPTPDKNCRIHCDKTNSIQRPTPLKALP